MLNSVVVRSAMESRWRGLRLEGGGVAEPANKVRFGRFRRALLVGRKAIAEAILCSYLRGIAKSN